MIHMKYQTLFSLKNNNKMKNKIAQLMASHSKIPPLCANVVLTLPYHVGKYG